MPDGRQPFVGVILSQEQTVLGTGSHHPVGLLAAPCDKVVDEHSYIGLRTVKNNRLFSLYESGGVYSGYKSLGGGFLVTGAAVELPGSEKPPYIFELKAQLKLGGVDAVILYGVGVSHYAAVFHSGQGAVHLHLNLLRQ